MRAWHTLTMYQSHHLERGTVGKLATITDGKKFDTNIFFSGGAGMFIQYHDIIKPVYLSAIMKLIITKENFGLPVNIISDMSILSIIEWYMNRRYLNPLKQLDYKNKIDISELDSLMNKILSNDDSIYRLAPELSVLEMFSVYRSQQMSFPVYVYSEKYEPYIQKDIQDVFKGIKVNYFFGDLKQAIEKCDQNFTYIFSDIELLKDATEILNGTYSHLLLARDYRYNYLDNGKTFKYDLKELALNHPFLRIGTILAIDIPKFIESFLELYKQEV